VSLTLHRCEHYAITFRFDGDRVRRVLLDASQYLAEIRRVEPKTTRPALPAWNSSRARTSVARWLYRQAGPRQLQDHFADVMIKPSGERSFKADLKQAWGFKEWTRV
jgi:hypothetical protein